MPYYKIVDNVITQKQPNKEDGFLFYEQDAIAGQVLIAGGFVNPSKPNETVRELAREKKRDEIRARRLIEDTYPVRDDANDCSWDGGFESAMKMDAAVRLSEKSGMTSCILYGYENERVVLTIDAAMSVVLLLAMKYQTTLAKKQFIMGSIKNASTLTNINSITWD
jgi:hypothetical protein